jgi:gas vesicle protein
MGKDNHTGRNIAIGALIAGVAGYVAGLLTAPKSGKETRADIAQKASDFKEAAAEEMAQLQGELKDLLNKAKTETIALSGKARAEFNEAVARAKDAQSRLTIMLKAVKAGEAEDPELNKAIKQAKAAAKNLSKYFKS